ncbi:hypothetical protein [Phenylobacterium montanum]|uniref:Tox-REase-5 domain-containing protein n=1 Tax=Phenylobacterium montanum TaxID=2823693 RepID=A0A975IU47_9CAUL|nr:hypothetical protein [Caulobacter sp. S6]QUD87423.1 hypothetical protein KCG34_20585 [Caulobacter sp. S6]
MLVEHLRKQWRSREATTPIDATMRFAPEGLVLGAGTLLAANSPSGSPTTQMTCGDAARLSALISAAYLRPTPPTALGHIQCALRRRHAGEDDIAQLHLALTGLGPLARPREAARRLFMADGLIQAGADPEMVQRLTTEARGDQAVRKFLSTGGGFNPLEPRILAGNGRPSGEWTRVGGALARLSVSAVKRLAAFAADYLPYVGRVAPPVVFFSVLLIPTNKSLRVEGSVFELKRLHYLWYSDGTALFLSYDGADGRRKQLTAQLSGGGLFRDPAGNVVARKLSDDTLAVDLPAISPDLVKKDEPNLCPTQKPDRPGGKESDRDFEDRVKALINPKPPTPRGFGYWLPNPDNGGQVVFDDCQRQTGILFEIKGQYGKIAAAALKYGFTPDFEDDWLKQSARQVAAAGPRPVYWIFKEPSAAEYAQKIFEAKDNGRERIHVYVLEN